MTKKCKQVQRQLDRYLRTELSEATQKSVVVHLAACEVCREVLEFHRMLDAKLGGNPAVPDALRMRTEACLGNPAGRRSWLAQALGEPIMKKILLSSTALAVVLITGVILAPSLAQGSTPHEKFVKMRSALAQAAFTGEIQVSVTADKGGLASFSVLLDGNPLPPDVPIRTTSKEDGNVVDYTITIDLSGNNFSSMQFGKDQNTLNLIPKGKPGVVDVVHLDPKSAKPLDWSTFELKQGTLQPITSTSYKSTSNEAEASKPAGKSSDVITLHIRVSKASGSSSVIVKKNGN